MVIMAAASFGVMGLGVMGSSLCLNLAEKTGEQISGYDLTMEKCASTMSRAAKEKIENFEAYSSVEAFVQSLKVPRHIILLVPAGAPVEACLFELGKYLEAGDLIMDGGNEYYEKTEARAKQLHSKNIQYIGCGVSGGAEGARHGPAMMVGGPRSAWIHDEKPTSLNIALQAIAAKVNQDEACVVYCGTGGAGNYVKMVHNGIEYGDMQLIGEAYAILREVGHFANNEIADFFEAWNADDSILQSYLIEITASILRKKDTETQKDLIDLVLDKTGSKGTGKWTVQSAADKGVPVPTIAAALEARYLSARHADRQVLKKHKKRKFSTQSHEELPQLVFDALLCAKITSYAQGLALLSQAKTDHGWNDLDLPAVLRCWRGGCIIRAKKLLALFALALKDESTNLILNPTISDLIYERQDAWRRVLSLAISNSIPTPAFASSLAYFDALQTPRLHSAALVQAQRDCFGGHTYRRIDSSADETFTSNWLE